MRGDGIDVGKRIRDLRKEKDVSREQLSEMTGISRSHIEKIEAGARRPGIDSYCKILDALNAQIAIISEGGSTQEKSAARAQEIFMNSTAEQAAFMIHVLESMAEKIDMLT